MSDCNVLYAPFIITSHSLTYYTPNFCTYTTRDLFGDVHFRICLQPYINCSNHLLAQI